MTRQEANREILAELSKAVELHPDWRFGQILFNLDVVYHIGPGVVKDPFHEESTKTLARIRGEA